MFSREVTFTTPQAIPEIRAKIAALHQENPTGWKRDGRQLWKVSLSGDADRLAFRLSLVALAVFDESEGLWPIAHAQGTATLTEYGYTLVKVRFQHDIGSLVLSVAFFLALVVYVVYVALTDAWGTAQLICAGIIFLLGIGQWFVTLWTVEGRVLGRLRKRVFGAKF